MNYRRADVRVEAVTTLDPTVAGGDGMRGFVTIVNLATGASETRRGSWGGDNPWSRSPVDRAESFTLPPDCAVVKGTTGHGGTFATVYARPEDVGRFLPPAPEDADTLTDADQQAIYCFAAIKGGEYRRDEMRRRGVTEATVDSLVERGYLKRNRAGATQITTKGKNARTIRN